MAESLVPAAAAGWAVDADRGLSGRERWSGLGRSGQLVAFCLGVLGLSTSPREGQPTPPGGVDVAGGHAACSGDGIRSDAPGLAGPLAGGGRSDHLVSASRWPPDRSSVRSVRLRQHHRRLARSGLAVDAGCRASPRWLATTRGRSVAVHGHCAGSAAHPVAQCHGWIGAGAAVRARALAVDVVAAVAAAPGLTPAAGCSAGGSCRSAAVGNALAAGPGAGAGAGKPGGNRLETHPLGSVAVRPAVGVGPPLVRLGCCCLQRSLSHPCCKALAWPCP